MLIDKGVRRHLNEDAFFVFSFYEVEIGLGQENNINSAFWGMYLHIYKIVSEQSLNEE